MPSRQGGAEERDGGVALTPLDFPDYAELWREQTSPEELALLQARARTIVRSASRRKLRDTTLALLAGAAIILFLWLHPTSLRMQLAFVPLLLLATWFGWWRHQITKAARAIAIDPPRAFFESAIANLRAEIRYSSISLVLVVPFFFIGLWLVKAAHGVDLADWLLRLPRDINFREGAFLALAFLSYFLFLRELRKLREQLRRLEAMRLEWEEQPGR